MELRKHETINRSNHNGEDGSGPLWVDDDAWVEGELPARPWVVPGFLMRGAVTVLSGPPGVMKSMLSLSWACSLALGRPFGGFVPRQAGPVIVYNVEDNQNEQRRRLSATLRSFGSKSTDIAGKVMRCGPNGLGTLVVRDKEGIMQTAAMEKIEGLIAQRRPLALFLDPLAELHRSEENDNTALREVVAVFRAVASKHDIAVCILHHASKAGSSSPGDPNSLRGASAIVGAARIVLTLTGMEEADARGFGMPTDRKARSLYARLDDAKANYSGFRETAWFEKVIHTLDNKEAVPAAAPWMPPEAKEATQLDLEHLAEGIRSGSLNGEPWARKLGNEARSVRHLLHQHGFIGDAEQTAIARLETDYGMVSAPYRRPNRVKAMGLRINELPKADWT